MVIKEPGTISKEIRGELQGQSTSVSDRTIPRCLSQSGLDGRQLRTPLLKANHKKSRPEFAKMHIDEALSFWEKVLWTNETKPELSGKSRLLYVHSAELKPPKKSERRRLSNVLRLLCSIWHRLS